MDCILRASCRAIVEASILTIRPIPPRYRQILSRRIARVTIRAASRGAIDRNRFSKTYGSPGLEFKYRAIRGTVD